MKRFHFISCTYYIRLARGCAEHKISMQDTVVECINIRIIHNGVCEYEYKKKGVKVQNYLERDDPFFAAFDFAFRFGCCPDGLLVPPPRGNCPDSSELPALAASRM